MISRWCVRLFVVACFAVGSAAGWAQGTGGSGIPGGDTGGGTPTQGTVGGTGGTGGGSLSGLSGPLELGNLLQIGPEFTRESMFENERIQPFVGPSSDDVIHPRSQIDPPGSSLGSTGGSFRLGQGNQAQFGQSATGFGTTGVTGQGFSITRRGVRSALQFQPTAVVESATISSSFSGRLTRLPVLADVGLIEMSVENRVATLRGQVATDAQKALIGRQAELEPGVSRVVNNLIVTQ